MGLKFGNSKKFIYNHQNVIKNQPNNESEVLLAALSCVSLHTFTEALVLDSEHLHCGTACASSHMLPVSIGSNTSAQMRPVDAGNRRNRKISGFTEMKRFNTRKTFNVSLSLFFSMQAPS